MLQFGSQQIYINYIMQEYLKKSIGFIKNPSNRNIIERSQKRFQGSSSGQFSSFQKYPRQQEQDFSSYRGNGNHQYQPNKPDAQSRGLSKFNQMTSSINSKVIHNNFMDEVKKQERIHSKNIHNDSKAYIQQIKSGSIYSGQSDGVRQYSSSEEIQFRGDSEELSFKNIKKDNVRGTVNSNALSSNQRIKPTSLGKITHKYQKQYEKKKIFKQDQSEESQNQSAEGDQNYKLTVKQNHNKGALNKLINKERKQKMKQKDGRKKIEEEQLIVSYDKKEFKDKTLKTAILNHHKNVQRAIKKNKKNVKETKGGICFQLDKHQFTMSPDQKRMNNPIKSKKKSQEATRQQLLVLRQKAKIYDKIARNKIFRY